MLDRDRIATLVEKGYTYLCYIPKLAILIYKIELLRRNFAHISPSILSLLFLLEINFKNVSYLSPAE